MFFNAPRLPAFASRPESELRPRAHYSARFVEGRTNRAKKIPINVLIFANCLIPAQILIVSASHQPELPFLNSDSGYSRWHEECARYRHDLEQKLGVPLGVKAQVTLRDFERPFTGILEFVVGTERAPRLRLRDFRFDFTLDEIISIHRL